MTERSYSILVSAIGIVGLIVLVIIMPAAF